MLSSYRERGLRSLLTNIPHSTASRRNETLYFTDGAKATGSPVLAQEHDAVIVKLDWRNPDTILRVPTHHFAAVSRF